MAGLKPARRCFFSCSDLRHQFVTASKTLED